MKKLIKKILTWQFLLPAGLIGSSILIYFIHFQLFHDAHHIFIYFFGDLAFVPIEVLLVTLIIHRILNQQEKQQKFSKLNMIIGAFYSEVGSELIEKFSIFDPSSADLSEKLHINASWEDKKFTDSNTCATIHSYNIQLEKNDVKEMREYLIRKREFLLRLLENPNLLEHDAFTDLLWSVFHLMEEVMHRRKVSECTPDDLKHIAGDIKRVYCLLTKEWLMYMKHIKKDYPYLFSLAVRTNPFDQDSSAVVKND